MAYVLTSKSATRVKNVGITHSPELFYGVAPLVGGTLTISIPGKSRVVGAWAGAQSANAAYVSATATNTFTVTGTSTDVIMWWALAE